MPSEQKYVNKLVKDKSNNVDAMITKEYKLSKKLVKKIKKYAKKQTPEQSNKANAIMEEFHRDMAAAQKCLELTKAQLGTKFMQYQIDMYESDK